MTRLDQSATAYYPVENVVRLWEVAAASEQCNKEEKLCRHQAVLQSSAENTEKVW